MLGVNGTDSPGFSTHYHGCGGRSVSRVAYALEQHAIGYAGSGKEHIITGYELRFVEHPRGVQSCCPDGLGFVSALRCKLAQHRAAERAHGTGCDHTFRCAADSHKRVDT